MAQQEGLRLSLTESPLHPVQQAAAVHAALKEQVVNLSACYGGATKHVGYKVAIQPAITG